MRLNSSAFALTKPKFIYTIDVNEVSPNEVIDCLTISPSHTVTQFDIAQGQQLMRAGGIPYHSLGEHHYEGTINFIYERSGQSFRFKPDNEAEGAPVRWAKLSEGWVSLW